MAEEINKPWSPAQMILSALGAVLLWTAIGFNWFGSGFNWSTRGEVIKVTESAVAENLASVCVAQAKSAPNSTQALAEFAALSSWKQAEYVTSAKWATMPGSETPLRSVVDACVTKLRET